MLSTKSQRRPPGDIPRGAALSALFLSVALALGGCPEKTDCKATLVTGGGKYVGRGDGPATDPSYARKKAARDACTSMCLQTNAFNQETCPSECVVNAEAGKFGMKISCTGDEGAAP